MTISDNSLQKEMDEILEEINKITGNVFIKEYVTLPEISVEKLKLLYNSLYYASVPKSVLKIYCIAAGIIQMGLDLHENVTNYKEPTDRCMRNRQLSILAGDYNSSHYYSLLAENNLIDEIKIFASAIRDINIAKMMLYTDSYDTTYGSIEHLFKLIKIKETSLYTYFLEKFFDGRESGLWQDIIEDMIILGRLSHELQTEKINKYDITFYLINYYANYDERNKINQDMYSNHITQSELSYLYQKYDIKHKIDDLILNSYNLLIQKIKEVSNHNIQQELYIMLNQIPCSMSLN